MSLAKTLATLSFCVLAGCSSAMQKETIFIGGTAALGADQRALRNQAIVVRDGRIVETSAADGVRARFPRARVIDVGDATILPGLTDAHAHLYGLGLSLETVNLVDTNSYEEIVARVKSRADQTPRGEWILGRGWDQNDWTIKEFPTRAALDAAVPDHPVWLRRIDGHAGLANTAALRAAGITAATRAPEGGKILFDEKGEPTGVFIDEAMDLVDKRVPPPSFELRKRRVLASAREIARHGLTEIHDAGADAETIRAVRELVDAGQLPIRLYTMLSGSDDALLRDWFTRGPLIDHGGRLTVRSVKLYADGALGSRGAALLEPYADDPANSGLLITKPERMADVSRRALASGFQVNTHAIGDRGVRNVIESYEAAGVKAEHRFRIEHLQVVAPADFDRLVRSGIIASMQPTHATSDMPWAERRVGAERVRGAYAWRTVLERGGRLALGSDFPVEAVNPFFGLYSAVTRQDHGGSPAGGWHPQQRLTLAEAIRGFTLDAAYAAFEESTRGTIEPGKLADFTIVEGDLFSLPSAELHRAKVKMTVVNGEVVYDAGVR